MNLVTLPVEILGEILSFLRAKDICSISSCCKTLSEAARLDFVWSRKCKADYRLHVPAGQGLAYKFYTTVLWKYGHLLGLWKAHTDCYGGLLQIKYEDFSILGIHWTPPQNPHITQSLRPKHLFKINLQNSSPLCLMTDSKKHSCHLTYGLKQLDRDSQPTHVLTRKCEEGDHQDLPDTTQELSRWMSEQNDFDSLNEGPDLVFVAHELLIYKFIVMKQFESCTNYTRLEWPQASFQVPIQPGLFKGTYSAHGIELIMLEYDSECTKVQGLKITGDKNVPAGQLTFRADLPYCMALTSDQQNSLAELNRIEPCMSDLPWNELAPSQPFRLPAEVFERFSGTPERCRARFHGFGQVAGDGFRHPSFIPGHWVVFNEDLFGFIWFELSSFSMYHRVKESVDSRV